MTEAKVLAQLEAVKKSLPMSRYDKLMHFAAIVRKYNAYFYLHYDFHLERRPEKQIRRLPVHHTLLGLAASDPVFKEAGLSGDTYGDVMDFLEIRRYGLHTFACGCHLHDQNTCVEQIEWLANHPPGFWARLIRAH